MPIYEYACAACGQAAEILQKVSDPPETECPACGKSALQKLVSAAGFRLNGGGWYETDFKSGSKKNLAGDSGKSDAGASCAPGGCEKPACAVKPDAPAASSA
jgi:putative FmdB family regulatory protein